MVRRRTLVLAGVGVLAAGSGGWWLLSRPGGTPAAHSAAGAVTASVVRTDLVARELIPGLLGYTAPWQLVHPGPPGVFTDVAAPGTTVRRGQMVYEVDGEPVVLLYGSRPVWRTFAPAMPPGEDVRQLEQNLAALGLMDPPVDDRFTPATDGAIRAWQRQQGRPVTGRLSLGTVVFAPGEVRVLGPLVNLGGRIGAEPVLRIAATTRGVTAALPLARAGQVKVGDPVELALPGGLRTDGVVMSIGVPTQIEGGAPTAIPMIVRLQDPAVAGEMDQVPVQVAIVVVQRKGVLAVPVTALSAAVAGGYEVTVVDDQTRRAVSVRPGLVDERAGLIEVSGGGLAEGMLVEVPAQ